MMYRVTRVFSTCSKILKQYIYIYIDIIYYIYITYYIYIYTFLDAPLSGQCPRPGWTDELAPVTIPFKRGTQVFDPYPPHLMDSSKGIWEKNRCWGAANFRHQAEMLNRINSQIVSSLMKHTIHLKLGNRKNFQSRKTHKMSWPIQPTHACTGFPPSACPPHLVELGAPRSWVFLSAAPPAAQEHHMLKMSSIDRSSVRIYGQE